MLHNAIRLLIMGLKQLFVFVWSIFCCNCESGNVPVPFQTIKCFQFPGSLILQCSWMDFSAISTLKILHIILTQKPSCLIYMWGVLKKNIVSHIRYSFLFCKAVSSAKSPFSFTHTHCHTALSFFFIVYSPPQMHSALFSSYRSDPFRCSKKMFS